MIKNNIIQLLILLVILAILALYMVGIYTDDESIITLVSISSPLILSFGVLIASLALKDNKKFNEARMDREESVTFFKECERKFDNIDSMIDAQIPSQYEGFPSISVNVLDNIGDICTNMHDLSALVSSIKHPTFIKAYVTRFKEIRREIYTYLERTKALNFANFTYGEGEFRHRVEMYNELRKEFLEEGKIERVEDFRSHDDKTPFPNGVRVDALYELIHFFAEPIGRDEYSEESFSDELNCPKLESVREYIALCASMKNIDGELIFKE